jgi:glycosyltransferase involved in cell wall biosynthesis
VKRVLFLAYYFPPLGGAGVQRTVKFVEQLPSLGYEPVVVTGPERRTLEWSPDDESLAASIPEGTRVLRVPGVDPPRSSGWRGRAERWLRRPTPFTRWWTEGAVATGRLAGEVDLIYASMSPFPSGEAAVELARRLGKPCVLDLRDPWALDDWLIYPSGLHRRLELRRMRRTLAAADAVVMNTAEATRQVLRHVPELATKPVVTIPNGFDAADFAGPPPQRDDHAFRIVHAGFVHTGAGRKHRRLKLARRALGGYERGLDILTRSHVFLLEAVSRVAEARPDLRERLEVHLIGVLGDSDRDVRGFEFVREHGYLPHGETVGMLRSADLLFLPMHDLAAGHRARIVPGKTYEYLAAGAPILAAVPEGDARDLLELAGHASICRPSDVDAMAAALVSHLDRVERREPAPAPRAAVLRRYERSGLSRQLASLFDDVLAGGAAEGRGGAAGDAARADRGQ